MVLVGPKRKSKPDSPTPVLFDPALAAGGTDQPDLAGKGAEHSVDVTAEFVGKPGAAPITVSALLGRVKGALAAQLGGRLAVVGEISNFRRHDSGHLYFSLKDPGGQIAAVMFRAAAAKCKFEPADGLEVVAEGRVDVYEVQGKLQLYVTRLSPRGEGALELAFRQLVEKLRGEGLFDPARKKPLPAYPAAIGVITSPTGAAVRDICRTIRRRWPAARIHLIGVRVQGEGAADEIARAIRLADANAEKLHLDVLIVGRGGGSLEDLWAFNTEPVARAIFDCRVPIVSGVGHETDTTVADMVADLRAATPTAAAERATPDRDQLRRLLAQLGGRLGRNVAEQFSRGRAALKLAERSEFFRNPLHRIHTLTQRVDEGASRLRGALIERHGRAAAALHRLQTALRWSLGHLARRRAEALAETRTRLAAAHPTQRLRLGRRDVAGIQRHLATLIRSRHAAETARLDRLEQTLEALSYRAVLGRGYSVTRDAAGKLVRSAKDVAWGDRLQTELADGRIRSLVEGPRPRRRRPKPSVDPDAGLFSQDPDED